MRILVTGASGLVGAALCRTLEAGGHTVLRAVRRAPGVGEVGWDPGTGFADAAAAEGLDAVVHLAGENVASGRWTAEKKRRIRESRVAGTQTLVAALRGLSRPPAALVCASAIGFYGHCGDAVVDEDAPAGKGFLAGVCRDWEQAARAAEADGLRVVCLRIGLVLSERGGALERMLLPFKLGLGGVPGDPGVWMSWITLDDLVGVIVRALEDGGLRGPVNAFTPNPVTAREFVRALGRAVRRPAFFHVPSFVLRAALGEMADGMLFMSVRGAPARLVERGYRFRHASIDGALGDLVRR